MPLRAGRLPRPAVVPSPDAPLRVSPPPPVALPLVVRPPVAPLLAVRPLVVRHFVAPPLVVLSLVVRLLSLRLLLCGRLSFDLLACGLLLHRLLSARSASCCAAVCRSASCRADSCRAASCRAAACRSASCRAASCRAASCGRFLFCCSWRSASCRCGLLSRRLNLIRLSLCLLLGLIVPGLFSASLPRLLLDTRLRCFAGVSKRRHRGFRARGAWRCGDDSCWRRWSGGHNPRRLVGLLHRDHCRRRCRRRCCAGPIGAQRCFRRGPTGRVVCPWIGLRRRIGLRCERSGCRPRGWRTGDGWRRSRRTRRGGRRSRRTRRGWRRRRRTGRRLLDPCLLQWLCDQRHRRLRDRCVRRLRGRDLRRNECDAQVGRLDTSIPPGKGETRKSKSVATKRQAQQRHVDQQGQQQRKRQSAAFETRAFAHPWAMACGLRRSDRLRVRGRCRRVAGTCGTQSCSAVAARTVLLTRGRMTPGLFTCIP